MRRPSGVGASGVSARRPGAPLVVDEGGELAVQARAVGLADPRDGHRKLRGERLAQRHLLADLPHGPAAGVDVVGFLLDVARAHPAEQVAVRSEALAESEDAPQPLAGDPGEVREEARAVAVDVAEEREVRREGFGRGTP